ncbi:ATP-binding protein [Crassaminicella profunda]|uniref:ATP-binding protein n=1 Tax=Crassaminicella profunda TaxID=1286698 RepID=UPI001CA74F6C|nr:ATP-binding protein [Crassaminicella profunda]QZY54685.1 ATP-binding protein [Crassaminicella profunda]
MIEVEGEYLAEMSSIECIDEWLQKIMEQVEFPYCKELHFAAHEAVINSIEATEKYYGKNHHENIKIKIIAHKERVEIIIRDKCGGLKDEVAQSLNQIGFDDIIWNERGRGMLFIKHFVDNFTYDIDINGDAVFRLIKGVRKDGKNQ